MELFGLMVYVNGTATTYSDLTLVGKRLFGLFLLTGRLFFDCALRATCVRGVSTFRYVRYVPSMF